MTVMEKLMGKYDIDSLDMSIYKVIMNNSHLGMALIDYCTGDVIRVNQKFLDHIADFSLKPFLGNSKNVMHFEEMDRWIEITTIPAEITANEGVIHQCITKMLPEE